MYILALSYLFFGVAIISDNFMAAVEQMTEQTRPVKQRNGDIVQVPIWNSTVANLTLLAFGSSAPEIILSLLDTITQLGKTARTIGSGTILGSAVFNLLVIPAVCTLSLPVTQVRKVTKFKVFATTAVFSIWAYVWVYICLVTNSPGAFCNLLLSL